jgi:hypothetical protein
LGEGQWQVNGGGHCGGGFQEKAFGHKNSLVGRMHDPSNNSANPWLPGWVSTDWWLLWPRLAGLEVLKTE